MQCIVRNCKSYWIPNSDIKFHSFPKNIERRNRWLSAIPIKGKFYKSARICSIHFKIEDYDLRRPGHLLETAVPSILRVCDCVSSAHCAGYCALKRPSEVESINNFLEVSYQSTASTPHQDSLSGRPHIGVFQQLTCQANELRCRFCAQTKLSTEIIDLTSDIQQKSTIVKNLSIFNGHNVDFSDESLPETICMVCRDTLNLCYMFRTKIRQSQILLQDYGSKNKLVNNKNHVEQSTIYQEEKEPCSDTDNDNTDFDRLNEHCEVKEEIVDIVYDQQMEGDPLTSVGKEVNTEDMDKMNDQAGATFTHTEHFANKSSEDIANESPILSNLLTTSTKQLLNKTPVIKKCLDNNTFMPRIEFIPKIPVFAKPVNTDGLEQASPQTSTAHKKGGDLTEFRKTTNKKKQSKMADIKGNKRTLSGKICVRDSCDKPKLTPTDKTKSYKCGKCGKPFLDYARLKKHFVTHKYNKADPHMCMLCDKVYKNKHLLKKHVQEHAGIKYECDICGHTYNSKRQLVRHMRTATTHNKPPKPLLVCNLCEKAFRRKGQLREHEAIIHKNELS